MTNYAEIYVVRDPLAWCFIEVNGGAYVHVRACPSPPLPELGNGWTDCAKIWCVVRGQLAMRFTKAGDISPSERVTVHTFEHICSLPLVHHPKASYWLYEFYRQTFLCVLTMSLLKNAYSYISMFCIRWKVVLPMLSS